MPVIISTTGKIRTAGAQQVAVVLYAPNGIVHVAGSAGVFGAVVGKEVIIETNSTLAYPLELKTRDPDEGPLGILT